MMDVEAVPAAPRLRLGASIDSFVGVWSVLHTRARNEKAVAAELERAGVQHFLPLVRHRRTYGGKVRRVEIPLFPGYVFLCGDDSSRLAALKTNRVANVLEVADQAQLQADLLQIYRVVHSDEPVDLYPRLKRGARCRVHSGTLAGLEGVVVRRRGPWRVYVAVEFLGQCAELEIDSAILEVVE
ncbi:MAG: transcription termination/antitermination NusG family protein [Planctomycetota bacterium]